MTNKYVLGIDTSNYTTSVALIDERKNIICDRRRLLAVKQGGRGLRQSDALFQHIKNLPEIMEDLRTEMDSDLIQHGEIAAVSCSSRPRPVESSYMPVFLAGESFARSVAATVDIPCFSFSHQEGHIEAVKAFSEIKGEHQMLACHFSGGTCEVLLVSVKQDVSDGYDIEIIGGSKDISFGQVIDRAGVDLGMSFPAGAEMDETAVSYRRQHPDGPCGKREILTDIKVKDGWTNLSGIDTQVKRAIVKTEDADDPSERAEQRKALIYELFVKLSDTVAELMIQGCGKAGVKDVIMAGGVSSSRFIRETVRERLRGTDINAEFDSGSLSQDNAVGIALLGGKRLWGENL